MLPKSRKLVHSYIAIPAYQHNHEQADTSTEESFLPPPPGPPPTSSADPPAPQSPKPGLHIPEPTKIEEANAVNLNPTSAVKPALSAGMSATSGPMGDHMAEVFQDTEPALEGRDTKV